LALALVLALALALAWALVSLLARRTAAPEEQAMIMSGTVAQTA
jgi:flagellar biogenesis protein FliO